MSTIAIGMLITWILPEKIQGISIFQTYYNAGLLVHNSLTEQDVGIVTRIASFIALAAILYSQTLWLSVFNQQCVIEAVISHIPRVVAVYHEYAHGDSAIDVELTNEWLQARNTLIEFSITWLALSYIGTTWRILKITFWTIVPLTLGLICWSLASSLTRPKWRVVKNIRMAVSIPIGNILDWLDYLEEVLSFTLPRAIRHYHSRLTAKQRRRAPKYVYSTIGADEIRLLVFQPVKIWWTGIPEARMMVVPAASMDFRYYDAISYRWEDATRSETILIDGKRFEITRSAFESLLSRCQGNKARIIWIDAICIDQENQEEKAMQVKMMTDIYFKARTVIACPTQVWRPRLLAWTLAYKMEPPRITDAIYGVDWHRSDEGRFIPPRWRALALFARNSYFERAWIVQEVAAGCRVQIYLGGILIDWAKFYEYTSHLTETAEASVWFAAAVSPDGKGIRDKDIRSVSGPHPHGNIHNLASLRGDFDLRVPDVIPITFERALLETTAFKSSDPRDLVYAMMGVCRNDARAKNIIPDYSKSVDEVFVELARAVFFDSTFGSLDLLALAGVGWQRKRDTLPSWVPDLDRRLLGAPITSTTYAKKSFKAGRGKISVSAGPVSNSMALVCCVEDAITSLSDPLFIEDENRSHMTDVNGVRKKIRFLEHAMQVAGLDRLDFDEASYHFAETVLGGRDEASERENYPSSELLRYSMISWQALLSPMHRSDENMSKIQAQLDAVGAWRKAFQNGLLAKTNALIVSACHGRRFATTIKGRYCLAPPLARIGDDVVIPHGAQVPFLIRQTPIAARLSNDDAACELFELVGECYVDGIMDGEAFESEDQIHQEVILI